MLSCKEAYKNYKNNKCVNTFEILRFVVEKTVKQFVNEKAFVSVLPKSFTVNIKVDDTICHLKLNETQIYLIEEHTNSIYYDSCVFMFKGD